MTLPDDSGRLASILADMIRSALAWDEEKVDSVEDSLPGLDGAPGMYTLSAEATRTREADDGDGT